METFPSLPVETLPSLPVWLGFFTPLWLMCSSLPRPSFTGGWSVQSQHRKSNIVKIKLPCCPSAVVYLSISVTKTFRLSWQPKEARNEKLHLFMPKGELYWSDITANPQTFSTTCCWVVSSNLKMKYWPLAKHKWNIKTWQWLVRHITVVLFSMATSLRPRQSSSTEIRFTNFLLGFWKQPNE